MDYNADREVSEIIFAIYYTCGHVAVGVEEVLNAVGERAHSGLVAQLASGHVDRVVDAGRAINTHSRKKISQTHRARQRETDVGSTFLRDNLQCEREKDVWPSIGLRNHLHRL